jgi:hypothetical protein
LHEAQFDFPACFPKRETAWRGAFQVAHAPGFKAVRQPI